jgi:uncharacterized membrane protein YagU involved in acid resistance
MSAKPILLAGLLVGTLDITAACINAYLMNGVRPEQVLKYVASGVFGKSAFTGGTMMAVWGLIFHFIIAYGCTVFFFWIYPRMPWLQKNLWITGIVYGLFIWIVTARIIVPLSNTPPAAFRLDRALVAWGILVLAIGWPLAFLAQRWAVR